MYGKIAAKRKQYAIKPRIAMTIHKALGGDFGSVATSVNFSNRDFGYRLWQKEQVEVLDRLEAAVPVCPVMAASVSTGRRQEADFRRGSPAGQSQLAATSGETRSRPGAVLDAMN